MFVGIDGCKAGWFVFRLAEDWSGTFGVFPTIDALWEAHADAQVILIDIPIGLPENARRSCDAAAKAVLAGRSSSVYPVPVRAAIYASTYDEAKVINQRSTGKMFSKQLWEITKKIREVDTLLRANLQAQTKIREIHPEVLFRMLSGQSLHHKKKESAGFEERLAILEHYLVSSRSWVIKAQAAYKRGDVATDDIVDALAAAITAKLGNFATLPEQPEHDSYGLAMEMVYTKSAFIRPQIRRVNHIQITIPKGAEEAGRAFYCDMLGLPKIEKPDILKGRGGFWVQVGDMQLHIGTEDGFDRQTTKGHVAYQVDDAAYWLEKLRSVEGVEIAESIPLPGYERFECRDPFGNRVEIIQPLT